MVNDRCGGLDRCDERPGSVREKRHCTMLTPLGADDGDPANTVLLGHRSVRYLGKSWLNRESSWNAQADFSARFKRRLRILRRPKRLY